FLFYLPPEWNLFWYSWTWLRDLCCPLMVVFGLGIMVYTGVLLSSMKSKPFWNTPALPVLFTTSALSTASAALAALAGLWPAGEHFISAEGAVLETEQVTEIFVEQLHTIDTILVMAEIVVLLVYVILMRAAGNVTARAMADSWLRGKSAPLFWGGMVVAGLLLPFLFYVTGGILATAIAPVLVLAAGLLLRFMVVYADVRRPIPGEERYWSRVPKGDEKFLTAWK
ncbi:MAG: polysulfide reductase NrfD, partial [Coriobacteriales bacterium]|nr:polysulfide reductase NrfD [Coriobacteriales bacterium]